VTESLGPYELGRVHHADCREALAAMPAESVQCCVTSPPYWGLRKYDVPDLVWGGDAACAHEWHENGEKHVAPQRDHSGNMGHHSETMGRQGASGAAGGSRSLGSTCCLCGAWRGQLGLEPTPDLYVAHMVSIFREVRRVLHDDGTLWLNIGDAYNAYNHNRGPSTGFSDGTSGRGHPSHDQGLADPRLKPKDLIGIPWLLAFALRADGWFLRAEIIWHKTAPMPESVRDRPTRAHEQVFLLSKSGRYFYDHEAASDEATYGGKVVSLGAKSLSNGTAAAQGIKGTGNATAEAITVAARRNWRTVWTIGPEPSREKHYAPFPTELARRCIVAGTKKGDVVLDPFAGTGTVASVAEHHGRRHIGFDLGGAYTDLANRRIAAEHERLGEVRPAFAKAGQQAGLFAGMESKP